MSTHPNFFMVVDHLVDMPPRGMLARGRLEGGELHVGDAVLVENTQGGKTVQVEQISVEKKMVRSAAPGSMATLLLAGLRPEDIRPGDRLLPGRAEEAVHPPEAGPWNPLPERIYPIRHLREILGPVALLAFLVIFMAVPIIIFLLRSQIESQGGIPPGFYALVFFVVIPGLMAYCVLRRIRRSLKGRKVYQSGNATTTARILNRREVFHSGKDDNYYTYHTQVEFTATLAQVPSGVQRYQLPVSEKLYDQLLAAETVPLTYATQDPRIFVIEGE